MRNEKETELVQHKCQHMKTQFKKWNQRQHTILKLKSDLKLISKNKPTLTINLIKWISKSKFVNKYEVG